MAAKLKSTENLFIDIETVAQSPSFRLLPDDIQELWSYKARRMRLSANKGIADTETMYDQKAGIYAEFAKVICISCIHLSQTKGKWTMTKKSFYSKNESEILLEFSKYLNDSFNSLSSFKIIGHNIKEFDIPFLARRMIVNEINLPKALDLAGKKPWQIDHLLDTMNLWKFGDFKNYTSLNLLAKILNVPSPKEVLDGSKVHSAYWLYNDLPAIVKYCEVDVLTAAKVFFKLKQKPFPKT